MPPRSLERNRKALAEFVRHRRNQLSPQDTRLAGTGLGEQGRRRAKGLRREEVATLAGVGVTWYTWFEQGREINVSAAFLDSIARVLQLDASDRTYLYQLAQQRPPATDDASRSGVPPLAGRLMDDFVVRPAFAIDARWDILAWNRAAHAVFDLATREAPNLLRLVFTDADLRRRAPDWEGDARRMLSYFRRDAAALTADPALEALIADVTRDSVEFREWWTVADPIGCSRGFSVLEVPGIGPVRFEHEVLVIGSGGQTRVVVHSAVRNAASSALFETLMQQVATVR